MSPRELLEIVSASFGAAAPRLMKLNTMLGDYSEGQFADDFFALSLLRNDVLLAMLLRLAHRKEARCYPWKSRLITKEQLRELLASLEASLGYSELWDDSLASKLVGTGDNTYTWWEEDWTGSSATQIMPDALSSICQHPSIDSFISKDHALEKLERQIASEIVIIGKMRAGEVIATEIATKIATCKRGITRCLSMGLARIDYSALIMQCLRLIQLYGREDHAELFENITKLSAFKYQRAVGTEHLLEICTKDVLSSCWHIINSLDSEFARLSLSQLQQLIEKHDSNDIHVVAAKICIYELSKQLGTTATTVPVCIMNEELYRVRFNLNSALDLDEPRESSGDTRESSGDTRESSGDTRESLGDTRESSGDTRESSGDTRVTVLDGEGVPHFKGGFLEACSSEVVFDTETGRLLVILNLEKKISQSGIPNPIFGQVPRYTPSAAIIQQLQAYYKRCGMAGIYGVETSFDTWGELTSRVKMERMGPNLHVLIRKVAQERVAQERERRASLDASRIQNTLEALFLQGLDGILKMFESGFWMNGFDNKPQNLCCYWVPGKGVVVRRIDVEAAVPLSDIDERGLHDTGSHITGALSCMSTEIYKLSHRANADIRSFLLGFLTSVIGGQAVKLQLKKFGLPTCKDQVQILFMSSDPIKKKQHRQFFFGFIDELKTEGRLSSNFASNLTDIYKQTESDRDDCWAPSAVREKLKTMLSEFKKREGKYAGDYLADSFEEDVRGYLIPHLKLKVKAFLKMKAQVSADQSGSSSDTSEAGRLFPSQSTLGAKLDMFTSKDVDQAQENLAQEIAGAIHGGVFKEEDLKKFLRETVESGSDDETREEAESEVESEAESEAECGRRAASEQYLGELFACAQTKLNGLRLKLKVKDYLKMKAQVSADQSGSSSDTSEAGRMFSRPSTTGAKLGMLTSEDVDQAQENLAQETQENLAQEIADAIDGGVFKEEDLKKFLRETVESGSDDETREEAESEAECGSRAASEQYLEELFACAQTKLNGLRFASCMKELIWSKRFST